MMIEVLICRPDGSQQIELRELEDTWYGAEENAAPSEQDEEEGTVE